MDREEMIRIYKVHQKSIAEHKEAVEVMKRYNDEAHRLAIVALQKELSYLEDNAYRYKMAIDRGA